MLLQRILQNLVSNAIRYTAPAACWWRAAARGARLPHRGDRHRLRHRRRPSTSLVFEEFFRGGARGARAREPGLGLGLSIVRRMALGPRSPLDLASRAGHGTRMALTVPVSLTPPDARGDRSAPVATRLTGARVLVVENDAGTADALQRLLRTWDAEVATFRDLAGVEAALRAGGLEPDLLDPRLPSRQRRLRPRRRRAPPGRAHRRRLPVIVTTADHAPEIEAQAAAPRARELVHKPIRPAQLRALLTYLLA